MVAFRPFLTAVTLCIGAALAVPSSVAAQPLPGAQPETPALQGWVHDEAEVITPEQQNAMGQVLAKLEREIGVQFVVVAASDLKGQSIGDYAITTGQQWRVGERTRGNGLLLVVAPDERQARIEVGESLKPVLTEEFCARVVQLMVPSFREGRYADGLLIGVVSVDARLRKIAAELAG